MIVNTAVASIAASCFLESNILMTLLPEEKNNDALSACAFSILVLVGNCMGVMFVKVGHVQCSDVTVNIVIKLLIVIKHKISEK